MDWQKHVSVLNHVKCSSSRVGAHSPYIMGYSKYAELIKCMPATGWCRPKFLKLLLLTRLVATMYVFEYLENCSILYLACHHIVNTYNYSNNFYYNSLKINDEKLECPNMDMIKLFQKGWSYPYLYTPVYHLVSHST